jgi:two-component system sensor histidine kinase PhoQ
MPRRSISLQSRQLIAASIGLFAFLGLTGYALDQAFAEATLTGVRERLQTYAYAYLAGTDVTRGKALIPPAESPEPRFDQPGSSGLYAAISGELRWESGSAAGRQLPFTDSLRPGDSEFVGPLDSPAGPIYRFGIGVAWEVSAADSVSFTVFIGETTEVADRQIRVFRRTLWVYLGGVGLLLLALQVWVARWSLNPLRRVERDVGRVERGASDRLDGNYPRELRPLTDNLNAFIESERDHLARYRNTLGDLAHSLKTPLAVLRARLESDSSAAELREDVRSQVQRMDEIVAYQLSRAATSGHQRFAAPLPIESNAEGIVQGLEKVYADRGVLCEFEIDPAARFHGEQGDLMELLGNLLENAFKWAQRRVLLRVDVPDGGRSVRIAVEDDGPGIPEDKIESLLQRGVRGDERVHGHGIGLAIVQDIVRAYRGELEVSRSPELGGARFVAVIPPPR